MRRIIVSIFFAMALLGSVAMAPNIVDRLGAKEYTSVNCTYNPTELKCGNYYLSGKLDILSFGQSIVVEGVDIQSIIDQLDAVVIDTNAISDDCTLYVLYSSELQKYRVINNQKYNMQVCVYGDKIKLGYPAIYDSF